VTSTTSNPHLGVVIPFWLDRPEEEATAGVTGRGWLSGSQPRLTLARRWRDHADGLPILDDALASLLCLIVDTVAGGDHTILIARVEHAQLRRDGNRPST